MSSVASSSCSAPPCDVCALASKRSCTYSLYFTVVFFKTSSIFVIYFRFFCFTNE